jgi:group I intron endonuclease
MNVKKVFIYGLIDPNTNELRYVGKSVNPKMRLRKHISERSKHDSYKDRWVRKLYRDGKKPELLIIDEVLKSNWQFWEIHYISYFKGIGCRLTNGTIGGDQPPSTKGRKHTEESKKKMSDFKKGKPIPWLNNDKPRTDKHKNNLSKSLKGRKSEKEGLNYKEIYGEERANEIRERLSKSHIGLNGGENHPMYGKKHSDETKKKISKASKIDRPIRRIVVLQYDKNGLFIKEWESIKLATKELKINNISACCKGKLNTAGGFKWEYKNGNK